MKVRLLGIQPGTVTAGMSNEEYFQRQLTFAREKYDGEELVMFPELMNIPARCGYCDSVKSFSSMISPVISITRIFLGRKQRSGEVWG